MNKTYHARVFGGKEAQWSGIDQSKGVLYPRAVNMSLNSVFDDNIFKSRSGQTEVAKT